MGHNPKHATKWLSERIQSALHNLPQQQKRGVELLELREAEYNAGQDWMIERPEMEWSDAEEDFDIEEDVPLAKDNRVWRPSRRWIAKYGQMEDETSDWNLERLANEASKLKAQEEGSFNAMDGRDHKSQTSRDVLKRQHIDRTSTRKLCRFHHVDGSRTVMVAR